MVPRGGQLLSVWEMQAQAPVLGAPLPTPVGEEGPQRAGGPSPGLWLITLRWLLGKGLSLQSLPQASGLKPGQTWH